MHKVNAEVVRQENQNSSKYLFHKAKSSLTLFRWHVEVPTRWQSLLRAKSGLRDRVGLPVQDSMQKGLKGFPDHYGQLGMGDQETRYEFQRCPLAFDQRACEVLCSRWTTAVRLL